MGFTLTKLFTRAAFLVTLKPHRLFDPRFLVEKMDKLLGLLHGGACIFFN
jgi:hypothetical protein